MSEVAMLFRLQEVDLDSLAVQRRLLEVKAQQGETEALREARQRVEMARKEAADWRTRMTELELTLDSLTEKIEAGEKRLYGGRIRNPKELESLQMETASLKKRLGTVEEEALQAMERVEETRAALSQAEQHLQQVEAEWREMQAALKAEQQDLQRKLASLRAEREKVVAALSPEALSAYDDLRKRKGGRAVARLEGNVCQGCQVSVSANKVRAAQAGGTLAFCGNCERILYTVS